MHTASPPVTEDDLRVALLEHITNKGSWPVVDAHQVGALAEKLITAATRNEELWFAAGVLILSSFRRHGVRRDATRLLLRLAAECELQSEGG